MSDVFLVVESSHTKGGYYRIDFLKETIQRYGLKTTLCVFGEVAGYGSEAIGIRIKQSLLLRLLNFLAYLTTLRSLAQFGYLVKLWPILTRERPRMVVFYNFWTGLFLHFWRQLTGIETNLIWEWYDLSTRMGYYQQRSSMASTILMYLEERFAPSRFEALIVPTGFAQRLVGSWGHPLSKVHVLGEVRELNPYVNREVLEKRVEEIRLGGPIQIAWVGVIRHYQLDGLMLFLRALDAVRWSTQGAVIHIIGSTNTSMNDLTALVHELPEEITIRRHGTLSPDALDQLLAGTHMAVHALPNELFCEFIYSRKMADYLAASLPVAFSAVGGLKEIGDKFGVPFHLEEPESIAEALGFLSNPEHYQNCLLKAREAAKQEYSSSELRRKGRLLVEFLRGTSEDAAQSVAVDGIAQAEDRSLGR